MCGYLALVEENALLRVEPGGDVGRGHFADRVAQLGRVLPYGDGVQIDDAEDAIVRLLHLDPLHHGAQIIAQVQGAGRLHTGEDALLEFHVRARSLTGERALSPATARE